MSANKERVALLTAALRSGEYTQTCGVLCRIGGDGKGDVVVQGMCCLGVACEVAMKNGLELSVEDNLTDSARYYEGEGMILPHKVRDWYGFDTKSGVFQTQYAGAVDTAGSTTCKKELTAINDSGVSFATIADIIDAKIDEL